MLAASQLQNLNFELWGENARQKYNTLTRFKRETSTSLGNNKNGVKLKQTTKMGKGSADIIGASPERAREWRRLGKGTLESSQNRVKSNVKKHR